jgi:hypothetical protein
MIDGENLLDAQGEMFFAAEVEFEEIDENNQSDDAQENVDDSIVDGELQQIKNNHGDNGEEDGEALQAFAFLGVARLRGRGCRGWRRGWLGCDWWLAHGLLQGFEDGEDSKSNQARPRLERLRGGPVSDKHDLADTSFLHNAIYHSIENWFTIGQHPRMDCLK